MKTTEQIKYKTCGKIFNLLNVYLATHKRNKQEKNYLQIQLIQTTCVKEQTQIEKWKEEVK